MGPVWPCSVGKMRRSDRGADTTPIVVGVANRTSPSIFPLLTRHVSLVEY